MSDKFIQDTMTTFQPGQTVVAKVTNLDKDKQRFLVTLKISEVLMPGGDAQTRLINGLQERRAVNEMLAVKGAFAGFFCERNWIRPDACSVIQGEKSKKRKVRSSGRILHLDAIIYFL